MILVLIACDSPDHPGRLGPSSNETPPTGDTGTDPATTAETGSPATTGDTGPTLLYDGRYVGAVEVDVRITPYGYPPFDTPIACTADVVVAEGETPPISAVLDCTTDGVFVPGELRGGWTDASEAEGSILIGLTGPGFAPLADGAWEGEFALDPVSGVSTLTGRFVGSYRLYSSYTEFAWDGAFTAVR